MQPYLGSQILFSGFGVLSSKWKYTEIGQKIKKKFGNLQNQRCTWRVRALVCFVTKKLVRFTKYASAELNSKYQMILTSSLARASVIPTTFSSMISVNGSKITTAMGAMYRRRFIEFSFSLEEKKKNIQTSQHTKSLVIIFSCKSAYKYTYPSEESKIPCSTDLSALAAVAEIHIINPNKWKLGSPCSTWWIQIRVKTLRSNVITFMAQKNTDIN